MRYASTVQTREDCAASIAHQAGPILIGRSKPSRFGALPGADRLRLDVPVVSDDPSGPGSRDGGPRDD
jgi:hypothetical protein